MRVFVICEYMNARGGTQRQALELARHLQKLGVQTKLVTRVYDKSRCFPELANELSIIAATEPTAGSCKSIVNRTRLRTVFARIATTTGLNYALLYRQYRTQTSELAGLLQKAGAIGTDGVLNPHDAGPAAWAAARTGPDRTVWQCNDVLFKWGAVGSMCHRRACSAMIATDALVMRGVAKVAVLDHSMQAIAASRLKRGVDVVRSGVNVDAFMPRTTRHEARARFNIPLGAFVLCAVTLLNGEYRRTEDVIGTFGRMPPDVWLMLGAPRTNAHPSYLKRIEEAIRQCVNRERIFWLDRPFQNDEELAEFYRASDVFIFPNVFQTWGLAPLEAAASGCVVVISDGSGAHEIFTHGETAFIFKGADLESLSDVVEFLYQNADHVRKVGQAGQCLVQTTYTWRGYAQRMLGLFEETLRK
jgi:glycosyltransferase involved in cell wall biosynthesis